MLFDDINKVQLMGNITNEIEVKFTPSGTAVANFGIATNRSYKQGDEWKDEVTYHNIVVWGNLAQQLSTRASKGTRILVEGRLQVRTWDGTDGKKNYKTEVVAEDIQLIARYETAGSSNNSPQSNSGSQEKQQSEPQVNPKVENNSTSIDPDDLPF